MLPAFIASVVAIVAAEPRAARADGPAATATADETRTSVVYGVCGVGMPTGVLGVEAVHRFGSRFELSVGIGEGLAALAGGRNPGDALQAAIMPRARLGGARSAATFGVGASGGRFGMPGDSVGGFRTDHHLWGNLEVGYEWWTERFALRFTGGVGIVDPGIHNNQRFTFAALPYLGFSFGYPF